MKKTLLLTMAFLVSWTFSNAQWTQVMEFNASIDDLITFDGRLYVGGNYTRRNNGTSYWSSSYNGTSWSDLTNLMTGSGIKRYAVYQGELWATGTMNYSMVHAWDGTEWDGRGTFNHSHTGIFADGNTLYVGSDFGYASYTTNGTSFDTLAKFGNLTSSNSIRSIIRYGSDLIFAGEFDSVNTIAAASIARWDGTNWFPLGTGITSSGKSVNAMAVYNGDLYVAGKFALAGGVSTGGIAKWNGTTWSMVGSAPATGSNGIKDLMVYNNELYAVGGFTTIGGVAAEGVARWNGSVWTPMDFSQPTFSIPYAIEVYNGSIYLAVYSASKGYLFKYTAPVSAQADLKLNIDLKASPNPSRSDVLVTWDAAAIPDGMNFVLTDIIGQQAYSTKSSAGTVLMERNHLPSGIYFLSAYHGKTGNHLGVLKIVMQ